MQPAPRTTAELLIEAAAFSPEIFDWIALQLKAGRRPSEILGLKGEGPSIAFEGGVPRVRV